MRTPVPRRGDGEHYLPPLFLPQSPCFNAGGSSKPVQAGAGFRSTHRTPGWPQKVMQPSKAGEKGWETGRIYSVPSLVAQMVRWLPAMWETRVQSLGQEDPLEKEIATHSSTLAWKIPWMEEPDRLQFMESQRVGHDWVTSLSFFFSKHFTDVHLHNLISLPNKDWGTTQTHGDTWISLAQCLISRVIKTHLQNKQVHS